MRPNHSRSKAKAGKSPEKNSAAGGETKPQSTQKLSNRVWLPHEPVFEGKLGKVKLSVLRNGDIYVETPAEVHVIYAAATHHGPMTIANGHVSWE